MGNSSMQGKEWTTAFVQFSNNMFKSVLDIGPGQGTYNIILKPYMQGSVWTGVEVFKPYIDQFNLTSMYDHIYNEDIRLFEPDQNYDLIIAGDVLEHMTKEEAIEVVNSLKPRCKYFLISIPIVHWEQSEINNNPYEKHVKDDWSHKEIIETFEGIRYGYVGDHIGVYAIRGGIE